MWWIIFLLSLTYIPVVILEKEVYTNKENIRINIIYSLLTFVFLLIYDIFFNSENKNKKMNQIIQSYKDLLNKRRVSTILIILSIIVSYRFYLFYKGFINFNVNIYLPIISLSSIILSFLIGVFYFKEEINKYNVLGILLSILSIYCISYKID
tara:strand:- start:814 stop:1272 length:459 start_codon:yes stop_codon:yes gene_type:complete